MRYLCLVYHEESCVDALPDAEYNAVIDDVLEYREELRQRGHYIASSPLQSVQTATTIRVRNNKVTITDGPFAETKEQLGGFYLIEAADLNEAIRLASRMPPARIGSIEVRPLKEIGPMHLPEHEGVGADGGVPAAQLPMSATSDRELEMN